MRHVLGVAGLLLMGCGGSGKVTTGTTGMAGAAGGGGLGGAGGAGFVEVTFTNKINNNLDLLFVIENGSSTTSMQQKLVAQLPAFIQVLQSLPNGLPNLHIAFVSTDMGAPGDSTSQLGCTTYGDDGQFHAEPRGSCVSTTLADGATFLSDVDGQKNFTDPIEKVLQCIALLGSSGCGFSHPLAAVDRALGAGDQAPPAANDGFLRPDAYLGVVFLTNEDDCSAPPDTTLYSLNGGPQSIANPLGPIAKYRCNRFGHLCQDPSGQTVMPPLSSPGTGGSPPILNLTSCTSNDTSSGMLTPVSTFIQHVRALKPDPDNQILIGVIAPPPDPYAVKWVAPSAPPPGTAGEVWPQVMESCGPRGGDNVNPSATQTTTDGTSGDPGVRLTQFARGFSNYVLASLCAPSYAQVVTAIATKLGALIHGPCVSGNIQVSSSGQPACTVTNHLVDATGKTTDVAVQNCILNGGQAPCWTLVNDPTKCPSGGTTLQLMTDPAAQSAAMFTTTVKCALAASPGGG